jgi:hypothetical protein
MQDHNGAEQSGHRGILPHHHRRGRRGRGRGGAQPHINLRHRLGGQPLHTGRTRGHAAVGRGQEVRDGAALEVQEVHPGAEH